MIEIQGIDQNELDSEKMNLARLIFISYFTDLYTQNHSKVDR
jgi:hypothetical protein